MGVGTTYTLTEIGLNNYDVHVGHTQALVVQVEAILGNHLALSQLRAYQICSLVGIYRSQTVRLPSLILPFTTTTAIHLSSSHRRPLFFKHPFFVFDMSQPSSSFQGLFNAALQEYQNQTGCELMEHPLAKRLETCDSVESITAILQEQAAIFRNFRGDDGKLMKSVQSSVDVLYTLSVSTILGEGIGLVFSKSFIEVPCS